MKLRVKNFGPIKQGPHGGDGFVRFDGVTILTSGTKDNSDTKVFTSLVAFMLCLEVDIENTYGSAIIEEGKCPLAKDLFASRPLFSGLESFLTVNTEIDWEGALYNIHIRDAETPVTFQEKGDIERSKWMYFSSSQRGEYSIFDNAIKDAIQTEDKMMCIIDCLEQGLAPQQQESILFSLLKGINANENNRFLFTTYSPYVLSALTNAVKAGELVRGGFDTSLIAEIIPIEAGIDNQKVAIYELDADGNMVEVLSTDNLPSDDNVLNNILESSNETFSKLLDIELMGEEL